MSRRNVVFTALTCLLVGMAVGSIVGLLACRHFAPYGWEVPETAEVPFVALPPNSDLRPLGKEPQIVAQDGTVSFPGPNIAHNTESIGLLTHIPVKGDLLDIEPKHLTRPAILDLQNEDGGIFVYVPRGSASPIASADLAAWERIITRFKSGMTDSVTVFRSRDGFLLYLPAKPGSSAKPYRLSKKLLP